MKSLLLITLMLFALNVDAQVTFIPDPIFEQALLDLGHDSDGLLNGQIATADAEMVTLLNIPGIGITDLTGIEAFINLNFLNVGQNELYDLDISQNTLLDTLACATNHLVNIDVSNNLELLWLNVAQNNLSSVDISNNPLLRSFGCSANALTELDLSSNPLLEYLWCEYNNLSTLDLSYNPLLRYLICELNNLTFVDISNQDSLEIFIGNFNNFYNLQFLNNPELEMLRCNFCGLQSVNISGCDSLYFLQLYSNSLDDINLSFNPNLSYIDLGVNELTSLDVTSNALLAELHVADNQLTSLDLSQNPLLMALLAHNNQFEWVSVKNGNNLNLGNPTFTGNPDLLCIEVDDQNYSETNWMVVDDPGVYSENCGLGISAEESAVAVIIDPITGQVQVNVSSEGMYEIFSLNGSLLGSGILQPGNNSIGLPALSNGIYLLQVQTSNGFFTEKIRR